DPDSLIYTSWAFMRGLTAPVFFTTAGLVFTYLLLGDGRPPTQNLRLQKGLRRGLLLLAWGYVLKINLFHLLSGYLSDWVFALDVLHCIGIALWIICALYVVHYYLKIPASLIFLAAGLSIFLLDPSRKELDVSQWPSFFQHYVLTDFGSVFTPLPWAGYACLGAVFACLLRWRPTLAYEHFLPASMIALGLIIHYNSSWFFMELYRLSEWYGFRAIAYSNTLFMRTGHVLILMASFMWLVPRIGRIPNLVRQIGTETLTIYCIHYVVLYGTWLGIGLSHPFYEQLSPAAATTGALLFVLSFVMLVYYLEPIRAKLAQITAWSRSLPARIRAWVIER
ncbi:MAG: hypothetical protein AAFU03_17810, partial [Bacteroidota bacterium]